MAAKSSKRLPLDMERSVARFVKDIVEHDFPKNAAGAAKGQWQIAKELGISQPVLSQCLAYDPANPQPLGIGINGLLALRKYSEQSIDAILGLARPERASREREDLEKLIASTEELRTVITSLVQKPSPNSKLGRAIREFERIRGKMANERYQQERMDRLREPETRRQTA